MLRELEKKRRKKDEKPAFSKCVTENGSVISLLHYNPKLEIHRGHEKRNTLALL